MRVIEYELKMYGQYVITNYPEKSDLISTDSYGHIDFPGIKMFIKESKNYEKFFSYFNLEPDLNENNADWMSNWQKAIRGESMLWKLTFVRISRNYMWMNYCNEALYRTNKLMNKEGHGDCAPEYRGSVSWYIGNSEQIERDSIDTVLRFEVPHQNNSAVDVYLALVGLPSITRVSEFDGNKKRTFIFGKRSNMYRISPVTVTEYMDFGNM